MSLTIVGCEKVSGKKTERNTLLTKPWAIQTQFCGSYAYVTTCLKCKMESKRPASFYELDLTLQGNKTLFDCLDCFLKEEKLEGDNQYFCGSCGRKQDATRCVRLSSLPTVLNLQVRTLNHICNFTWCFLMRN